MVSKPATSSLDTILKARELIDSDEFVDWPLVMTGRQARVLLGMPGRTINKARVAPVRWRGRLIRVEGL